MTDEAMMKACIDFFETLSAILGNGYVTLGSCNHDSSVYLVPVGTEEQVSYYGKPKASYRVSDHWNWFTSSKKNEHEHYIQCYSVDVPFPHRRRVKGAPTKPRKAFQVCFFGKDKKYHCVYGQRYDRKTRTWTWYEGTFEDAVKLAT